MQNSQTNLTKDFSNRKKKNMGNPFHRLSTGFIGCGLSQSTEWTLASNVMSQACSCWVEAPLPVTLGKKYLVRTDTSV